MEKSAILVWARRMGIVAGTLMFLGTCFFLLRSENNGSMTYMVFVAGVGGILYGIFMYFVTLFALQPAKATTATPDIADDVPEGKDTTSPTAGPAHHELQDDVDPQGYNGHTRPDAGHRMPNN